MQLICQNCGKRYADQELLYHCNHCQEPLEVGEVFVGSIRVGNPLRQNMMDRYSDFFPYLQKTAVCLQEGFTPLFKSSSFAQKLGIQEVLLKNETQNPTWSFKDRGTMVAMNYAIQKGFHQFGTVSTGNMAVSVAAYGAAAGKKTVILVGNDIAKEKLAPIAIYGAQVILVDGEYGNLYQESIRLGWKHGIYFINSDHPLRVEGYKTIAYEICEQTNFNPPDYMIVPTSSGGLLRGIEKGFAEFMAAGFIAKKPKLVCAQAAGCAPIVKAWENDEEKIVCWQNPQTEAHAIANPMPPSGNRVLQILRQEQGFAVAVAEDAILQTQKDLAQNGLFVQPASAVALAAAIKLVKEGLLPRQARIACVLTGSGLKYTSVLSKQQLSYQTCGIEKLEGLLKNL